MVCVFLWWTVSVCPSNSVCTHSEHCLLSLFIRTGTGQMGYVGAMHRKSRRQDPLLLSPTASLPQSKCLSLSQRLWVYPAVTKHCQECTSISSSPLFFYHLLSFPTRSSRTLLLLLSYYYHIYTFNYYVLSYPIHPSSTFLSIYSYISSSSYIIYSPLFFFDRIRSYPIGSYHPVLSYPILSHPIHIPIHSYSCHIISYILSYPILFLFFPILSCPFHIPILFNSFILFFPVYSTLSYPYSCSFLSCPVLFHYILYYIIISHPVLSCNIP